MKTNTKKVVSILLILLVVGATALFADAIADAYRNGYLKGYSSGSNNNPTGAAGQAGYTVTAKGGTPERAEQQRLRDSYIAGYKQGREDKQAGRENRYLY